MNRCYNNNHNRNIIQCTSAPQELPAVDDGARKTEPRGYP